MPLADLPKAYDPQAAQSRWYAYWLEKGYFHDGSHGMSLCGNDKRTLGVTFIPQTMPLCVPVVL